MPVREPVRTWPAAAWRGGGHRRAGRDSALPAFPECPYADVPAARFGAPSLDVADTTIPATAPTITIEATATATSRWRGREWRIDDRPDPMVAAHHLNNRRRRSVTASVARRCPALPSCIPRFRTMLYFRGSCSIPGRRWTTPPPISPPAGDCTHPRGWIWWPGLESRRIRFRVARSPVSTYLRPQPFLRRPTDGTDPGSRPPRRELRDSHLTRGLSARRASPLESIENSEYTYRRHLHYGTCRRAMQANVG